MKPISQTYHRGDVVLVLFPNSDLRTAKRRPALILQADNLRTGLPQVVIAMISSRVVSLFFMHLLKGFNLAC
jgi:mRNA interferase MazF